MDLSRRLQSLERNAPPSRFARPAGMTADQLLMLVAHEIELGAGDERIASIMGTVTPHEALEIIVLIDAIRLARRVADGKAEVQ